MRIFFVGELDTRRFVEKVAGELSFDVERDAPSPFDCLITEGGSQEPVHEFAARIFLISPGGEGTPPPNGATLSLFVVRGECETSALRGALDAARRVARASALLRVTKSPLSHDVRGAISVLRLAGQVIAQKDGMSGVATKVDAAARRLEDLLADLSFAADTRLSPNSDSAASAPPSQMNEATDVQTGWSQVLTGLETWVGLHHRGRALRMALDGPLETSPPGAALVLRGLVDGMMKLTRANEEVVLTLSPRRIVASSVAQTSGELETLLATSPEDWPPSGPTGGLFRFVSAYLLVRASGGSMHLTMESEGAAGGTGSDANVLSRTAVNRTVLNGTVEFGAV